MTDIVFGSLTIGLWFAIAATLYPPIKAWLVEFFNKKPMYVWYLVMLLATLAMCGSLWYSEIIGYEPCRLCWYQRIFMYPIVLIGILAIAKEDLQALFYAKGLAMVGALIAIFHIVEQRLPQAGLSCGSVGQATSCDSLWVNAFGLITIPTMAATIFVAIILVITIFERSQINKTTN